MPAKPSGEVKTRIVNVTQKNGDIYIMERQTLYDPAKKYNRVLGSKLIAKIPKGEKTPVPTRSKLPKGEKSAPKPKMLTASRTHVGMMDIIQHIGEASGIDDAVYASTDTGTAQKVISLARYLLATNGQTLPGIQTWQFNHPLPYRSGISEEVYHDLFVAIGLDESLQQNFFRQRCEMLGEHDAIAYDSTTVSTHSVYQPEARYGFNKAKDGLKTIKLLTLYSLNSRQPIAFTKQAGNLPDVTAISNALNQLTVLGVKDAEVVTDNGYYSEANLSEMLQRGFDFITLVKTSISWVRPLIDEHMEELSTIFSVCPYDTTTHGVKVMMMHEFAKERKYASHKTGAAKGSIETFRRRIYLHIFFNASRQAEDRTAFENDMLELKALIESGVDIEDLPKSSQSKVKKYMDVRTRGDKITVTFREQACKEAYKYHGYFVLVANKEKDCFEALAKYRKREAIEDLFQADKQKADGSRVRVWTPDTLRGRMFVQFVELCYYECFANKIRELKKELRSQELAGVHSGDSACIIPSLHISPDNVETIKEYTRKIAEEMHVEGLMNMQYAIENGKVYVLEANPRASRTVPLVSKVCNVRMVPIATDIITRELTGRPSPVPALEEKHIPYYGVKEAAFPFNMFQEVDPLLGPEMRSTGEVLGLSPSYGEAFYKAQEGVGSTLPLGGTVLISVNRKDKEQIVDVAKSFHDSGFEIIATGGTCDLLREAGLPAQKIKKLYEGRPNTLDAITNGQIDLIVNSPAGKESIYDDSYLRKAAIKSRTPYITTVAAARATAEGIRYVETHETGDIQSLQDLHAQIK